MVKVNMELPECCALCPCRREVDYSYHTGGRIYDWCQLGGFEIETDGASFRDDKCPMERMEQ